MVVGIHCGPTLVPIGPSRAKRAAALLNPHALDHEPSYESTPRLAPAWPHFHSYIGSKRYHKLLQDQIFKLQADYQISRPNPKWKSAHLTTLLHLVDTCLDSPSDVQLASIKSEVELLCRLQQRWNRRQNAQEEAAANALNQASLSTQDSLGSWICLDTPGKAAAMSSPELQSSIELIEPITVTSREAPKVAPPKEEKARAIKPQQGAHLVPGKEQVQYKTLDDVKTLAEAPPQVHRQVAMKKESTKRKQASLKKPKGAMVINAAKDWTFR